VYRIWSHVGFELDSMIAGWQHPKVGLYGRGAHAASKTSTIAADFL
jgi:hypothetical protein